MQVLSDCHDGSKAATTKAADTFEAEFFICRGFPLLDVKLTLNLLKDFYCALDMTGSTGTNGNRKFSLRLQTECLIKCREVI